MPRRTSTPKPRTQTHTDTGTAIFVAFGLALAAAFGYWGYQNFDTTQYNYPKKDQTMAYQPGEDRPATTDTGSAKKQDDLAVRTPSSLTAPDIAPTRLTITVASDTQDIVLRPGEEVELFAFTANPSGISGAETPTSIKYFSLDTDPGYHDRRTGEFTLGAEFNDMHLYANGVRIPDDQYNILGFMQLDRTDRRAGMWKYFVFTNEYRVTSPTRFSVRSSWSGTPRIGQVIRSHFTPFPEGREPFRGTLSDFASVLHPCTSSEGGVGTCGGGGVFTWSDLASSRHSATPGRSSDDWLSQYSIPGFSPWNQTVTRITGVSKTK